MPFFWVTGVDTDAFEASVRDHHALDRGYFESPSETSLDDIAEELGISRPAVVRSGPVTAFLTEFRQLPQELRYTLSYLPANHFHRSVNN